MNEPLRLLLVEDSESDAGLIVRILEKAGYELYWERVDDEAAMRAGLNAGVWNIIIADHHLPQFDAPAALRILHESGRDIPFIVVSGSMGEDVAVEMMRRGANDYLMKHNLARLAPAVEREIREARSRRERRQAEKALRESEERLALAIDATHLGTFDFDPATGKLIWSETTKRHFGLPADADASYEVFLQGLHPDDRDRVHEIVQDALRPGGDGQYATEYRTIGIQDHIERRLSAWGRVYFAEQGAPLRFIGVTLDITERKRLEEQFLEAQKLESVGRLAGGVAHDFNNLLTVITGYAEMMLEELSPLHPFRDSVEEISTSAMRATDLTRQLLMFSRRHVSEPKVISLNKLVRDFQKMLGRLIGEDVELNLSLHPEAGNLRADPCHIEQVIMNLAVNAKDAMPGGGKLMIATAPYFTEGPFARALFPVPSGSYVMLSVSDTGNGMSSEVQAHIFEPFYTTKGPGKGTGLGLSTVYGIVMQAGGGISVSSEPGHGSTFRMIFPSAQEEVAETAPPFPVKQPLRGSETILVAEDEPGVRKYMREILEQHGYTVLAASNGRHAMQLADEHEGPIHLLLTDGVMPEMGAAELCRQFKAAYPGVPILCISGYNDRQWQRPDAMDGYLEKPFGPSVLLTRIQALIGPKEPQAPH
jgi:PAS domain S-box-containing protein